MPQRNKISKKEYKVKAAERNFYHIQGVIRIHDERAKKYYEDYHIIKIDPKTYPMWDAHKSALGFDDFEILHKPKQDTSRIQTFKFIFENEEVEMNMAEMKQILSDHRKTIPRDATGEELVELLKKLNTDRQSETFDVTYEGEKTKMTADKMREILNERDEQYHPSTGGKKLAEIVSRLSMRED